VRGPSLHTAKRAELRLLRRGSDAHFAATQLTTTRFSGYPTHTWKCPYKPQTNVRCVLLPFLPQPPAAQRVGQRAAPLLSASPVAGGRPAATRRRTPVVIARRRRAGPVAARSDLVIEPQRQRDALARLVHVQHLHPHDVARF